MDVFTDAYDKSVELLKSPSLHADWKAIEHGLKTLLEVSGPSVNSAPCLDELRKKLTSAQGKASTDKTRAEEIVRASRADTVGYQDRAALVKQMQHFYLVQKKGNQSVWVVDFPRRYGSWTFDLFAGRGVEDLKAELAHSTEVFGSGNRKMMSDALQLARKWSCDVEVQLASKSRAVLAMVAKWFHAEGAKPDDIEATRLTLLDGFKKITATCNSTRVIFSDRPHRRASGKTKNTFASVNSQDVMPVIYIYELFLRTGKRNMRGKIPKLWLCALTVVHELSHKLAKTDDIKYDDEGLKPGPGFSADQALRNADSWAYFAGDLVGAVPKSTVTEVLV
jgi:Lysine-specific metallo-endopeptidase